MVHRGKRSVESLEFRLARSFCFWNSKFDPKRRENVFLGTQEAATAFVCNYAGSTVFKADIPDTPRGLVLADNRCGGFFDR
jgi:hypothetical protein